MKSIGIDVDKSGKIWTSNGNSINNISNSTIVNSLFSYCKENNITTIYHEDNRYWTGNFRRTNKDLIKVIQILKDKAKDNNIKLIPVQPFYTSLMCSKCKNIDKRSRVSKFWYICRKCKFKMQADVNAARNILYLGRKHAKISINSVQGI